MLVFVTNARKACVDLGGAASGGENALKFVFAGGADGHAGAVVEQDIERVDIVDGLATHEGVRSAGVVADHAAEGAAGVRGGIGREGEVMNLGGFAHAVENDAGLDDGEARLRDRARGWTRM